MTNTAWHIITCEYPPQQGGVSDYTKLVAEGLATAGDEVHVWCPVGTMASESESATGVNVHRELGRFTPGDLRRAGALLDQFPAPRRLLVQWVPHGYGYQAMNLAFCGWLWNRAARRHDTVEVMVHEPYLTFGEGSWKQSGAAAVQRLMTIILLRAARRVWISIPAWEARLRPYALGRSLQFRWLPVASNIAVVDDPERVGKIRERYAPAGKQLVGHFGTYERNINRLLFRSLPPLLQSRPELNVLLLGHGSEAVRAELLNGSSELAARVHATGALAASDLSLHLRACDLMIQPYPDGVSSRRTSTMVALSHGLPIVTTSGKLTEPHWAQSGAVHLVPAGDQGAVTSAAQQLLTDANQLRVLGAAASSLYRERFALEKIITGLREATA